MTQPIEIEVFEDYAAIRDIMAKTNKENPKKEDVAALRKMLKEKPAVWRYAGDLCALTIHRIVDDAGGSSLIKESTKASAERMKEEFGYDESGPLERMLIDQVVMCWLRLNLMEHVHWGKLLQSHSTEAGLYWEKRLSGAQRRFTRVCESLAKVRKLISETQRNGRAKTSQNVRLLNALTGTDG